jgi:hypothetical protein
MTRHRVFVLLVSALTVSAVAGCGSTTSSSPPTTQAASQTETQTTPSTSSTTTAAPNPDSAPDFVIQTRGQTGDKVKLEGRFGPPLPVSESDADHTVLGECPSADGREMTVRLALTATVESSLSGDVSLMNLKTVDPGFNIDARRLDFLMAYTEGPRCYGVTSEQPPGVDFGRLAPNHSSSFTLWVVLPDAITPDNPHPSLQALAEQLWLMAPPSVVLNSSALEQIRLSGPRVVECEPAPGEGRPPEPYAGRQIALIGNFPQVIRTGQWGLCK